MSLAALGPVSLKPLIEGWALAAVTFPCRGLVGHAAEQRPRWALPMLLPLRALMLMAVSGDVLQRPMRTLIERSFHYLFATGGGCLGRRMLDLEPSPATAD